MNLVNCVSAGRVHRVSTIVVHSLYNHATVDNDIAIMVLNSDLRLNTRSQTATILRQGNSVIDNGTVVAVGWGRTIVSVYVNFNRLDIYQTDSWTSSSSKLDIDITRTSTAAYDFPQPSASRRTIFIRTSLTCYLTIFINNS